MRELGGVYAGAETDLRASTVDEEAEEQDRSIAQKTSRGLIQAYFPQQQRPANSEAAEEDAGEGEADADNDGAGAPMADEVRAPMEQSFGADFSSVRIHQGADAEDRGAEAYAEGDDIHFAGGRYDPGSAAGRELLGHELAHVVQQREGRVAQPQQRGDVVVDAGLEAEADQQGARAARGEPARSPGGPLPGHTGAGAAQARRTKKKKPTSRKKLKAFAKEVAKAKRLVITRKKLLKLIARAQKLGVILDLRGASLTGQVLDAIDFTAVDLTGASLTNARMQSTTLGGLIRGADFSGADLRNATVPPDLPSRARVSPRTRLPASVRLHVPRPMRPDGGDAKPESKPTTTPVDSGRNLAAIATCVKFALYELAGGPIAATAMSAHLEALLREEGATGATPADVLRAGEKADKFTEKDGFVYLLVDGNASEHAPGDIVHRKVGGSWKPYGVARADRGTSKIDQHYMNVEVTDPDTGQKVTVTEEQVNSSRAASFQGKLALGGGREHAIGTEFIRDPKRRDQLTRGIKDGKLVSGDGNALDTSQSQSGFSALEAGTGGKQIYVMGKGGTLYTADPEKESKDFLTGIGRHLHETQVGTAIPNPSDQAVDDLPWRLSIFHHSSFLAGDDVKGAGEIQTDPDGVIKMLSNVSGHYKPDARALTRVCDALQAQGVDLTSAVIEFSTGGRTTSRFYAGAWIASRGNVDAMSKKKALNREMGAGGMSALLRAKAEGVVFPDKTCEQLFRHMVDDRIETEKLAVDDDSAVALANELVADYQASRDNQPVSKTGRSRLQDAEHRAAGEKARLGAGKGKGKGKPGYGKNARAPIAAASFHACLRAFRDLGKPYDPEKLGQACAAGKLDPVIQELRGLVASRTSALPVSVARVMDERLDELLTLPVAEALRRCGWVAEDLPKLEKVGPAMAAYDAKWCNHGVIGRATRRLLAAYLDGQLPAGSMPNGMTPEDAADWDHLDGKVAQGQAPNFILWAFQ